MKLYLKIFIILTFVLVLFACGPDLALREKTYYFQEENKTWLPPDTSGVNFIMTDNNNVSQSFMMSYDDNEFNKSWGGFLGINTLTTKTEYHYKSYSSSYGYSYSVSLTAGVPPFGDEISINIDGVRFRFDLDLSTISNLSTDFGYKSMIYTENGYEIEGDSIKSSVEILDSYSTSYYQYDGVLLFELNDFSNDWEDFTVVKIYIAKDLGLIKFVLKNGITYERKSKA